MPMPRPPPVTTHRWPSKLSAMAARRNWSASVRVAVPARAVRTPRRRFSNLKRVVFWVTGGRRRRTGDRATAGHEPVLQRNNLRDDTNLADLSSRCECEFYSRPDCCRARTSYLLTAAGQLWAWGANYQGQLGDGTRTERSVPQHVGFYPEDSRQRLPHGGSSSNHMMVVQHDGSIMGSGQTGEGQLGPDPLVSWRDSAGVTHRPSSSMLHAMALPALGADNAAVARGWVHTLLVKEQ